MLRLLANQMVALDCTLHISHEQVRQLLKKKQIKLWRVREWVLPKARVGLSKHLPALAEELQKQVSAYENRCNEKKQTLN